MPDSEIEILLDVIDQAYNRRSWHGTNLKRFRKNRRAAR